MSVDTETIREALERIANSRQATSAGEIEAENLQWTHLPGDYGYDESGNHHSDNLGTFGVRWRESPHPEFLLADLLDLIAALSAVAAGSGEE